MSSIQLELNVNGGVFSKTMRNIKEIGVILIEEVLGSINPADKESNYLDKEIIWLLTKRI